MEKKYKVIVEKGQDIVLHEEEAKLFLEKGIIEEISE